LNLICLFRNGIEYKHLIHNWTRCN